MPDNKPLLDVNNVSASHMALDILKRTNLQVNAHDIVCLLGPSGCGKTTLLRSIAGLHAIDHGSIEVEGSIVSTSKHSLAPESRNIGMMFQDLALFPHLTIFDNVAYGIRKQQKTYVQQQVNHVLDLVEIDTKHHRKYPHELSGGQQQRVALARALAPKPSLLLLDEPFSSLDPDLREQLATQVREILKHEKMTAVLVTHDQHEAFAVADWVGVMEHGKIVQFDTPYNIYHEPVSRFVADFVGLGNLIPATVLDNHHIETVFGKLSGTIDPTFKQGEIVDLLVRPDDIPHDDTSPVTAIVEGKRFLGAEFLYTLRLPNGHSVLCYAPSHHDHEIGKPLGIGLDLEHLVLFPR
ncbi:MAG: ABC transporter ATP-binding protein [Gammaproteobacteria bacterium]